jgi:hypothetical protein
MNDRAAMGVYQAVAAAGLSIPDDLSVISFDNSDVARWLDPGLSSVNLPYFALGHRAVELLLADRSEPRVHKLQMELRSRESVAPPFTSWDHITVPGSARVVKKRPVQPAIPSVAVNAPNSSTMALGGFVKPS